MNARSDSASAACGFRWSAPRVPTPDVLPQRTFALVPGGVITNPSRVEQVCALPRDHEGAHRSWMNVTYDDDSTGFIHG